MDGARVMDGAETRGAPEPSFSHKQASNPQQKPLNQVIKDEVLTEQELIEDHLRIKQESLHLKKTVISVKEEGNDAAPGECVKEEHDITTDGGELESDVMSENDVKWDRELAAKISAGQESDSSSEWDDGGQAEMSEDRIQEWKVNDDVCYPVHMKTATEDHTCSECGKTFTDKLYLKRHMIRHTGRRPFTCSVCKKSFTQNAHLRKHMRCHTGEKPFKCPMCDVTFSLKQNLHRHMTSHSGAKSFSCPVCEKGFTQKSHLSRHMGLHLGDKLCTCPDETCQHTQSANGQITTLNTEKPFICPFCSKGFTRKDHLSSHLRAHTGDKQFDCPECDAQFNLKQSLERHMTVHSGEKPFKCPDCRKGFTRNSTLKLHMRTHTGEKPFNCTHCDAKFNRKENFLRHLTIHTGERPFNCPVCKKDFVRKPSLDKHLKSHT